MKKYFVSSDVHGFFTEYMKALDDAGFERDNPEHIIIICGDMFDRGKEPQQLIDFILSMDSENRIILVRGNHEDLLMDLVFKKEMSPEYHDYSNGTVKTLTTLCEVKDIERVTIDKLRQTGVFSVIDKTIDYYELGKYIFVHGWIPTTTNDGYYIVYDPNWRNADKASWESARWKNGMEQAEIGYTEKGKTIVCGHWHCSYGNARKELREKGIEEPELSYRAWEHEGFVKYNAAKDSHLFKPFYGDGIIAIDACTAHTGFVNCLVIDEEEI